MQMMHQDKGTLTEVLERAEKAKADKLAGLTGRDREVVEGIFCAIINPLYEHDTDSQVTVTAQAETRVHPTEGHKLTRLYVDVTILPAVKVTSVMDAVRDTAAVMKTILSGPDVEAPPRQVRQHTPGKDW